jgi:hypothetical protein
MIATERSRLDAGGAEVGAAACLGVADWLSLAAAPTFAGMAVATTVLGGDGSGLMCLAAPHTLPLTGMQPMYVLMSAFHAAPWLRLISRSLRAR